MPSEYVDRITYKPFEYLLTSVISSSTITIHLRTTLFSTSTLLPSILCEVLPHPHKARSGWSCQIFIGHWFATNHWARGYAPVSNKIRVNIGTNAMERTENPTSLVLQSIFKTKILLAVILPGNRLTHLFLNADRCSRYSFNYFIKVWCTCI